LISIEVEHSFVLAKGKSVTKLHQIGFEHKLHLIKKNSPSKVKAYLLSNLAYFERSFLSPILPKQPNFPPPHVTQETTFWSGKKLSTLFSPLPPKKTPFLYLFKNEGKSPTLVLCTYTLISPLKQPL